MPNVSIIITIYNQSTHISKIMNSIFQQSYQDYEIIIINDGSTDNSDLECQVFTSDPRVRYFFIENVGVSRARNYGISQARGQFVIFIDGDDFIEADYIKWLVNEFVTDVGIVYCGVNKLFNASIKTYLPNHKDICRQNPNVRNPVWNKIFRLDLINNHKIKFPERSNFAEDYAFVVMYMAVCQQLGLRQVCIQVPLYNYVQHPQSMMAGLHLNLTNNLRSNNSNIESMLDFFQSYHGYNIDEIIKSQVIGYFGIELPLLTIYNQLIAGNITETECKKAVSLHTIYLRQYKMRFDLSLWLKFLKYRMIVVFGRVVRIWLK